jgi:membrane protease YdiL (CAAX protease family)
LIGKIKKEDLSLVINRNGKDYLYLLPVILVFIPVLVQGFKVQDARYLGGCFLLYLFVGIVEEIYFRGLIPSILGKSFSKNQVIWISTLIFGISHIATAFNGEGPLLTVMTILNALIFGFMAICLLYHTKTIFPLMLIHFLFDFETKIINLNGTGLAIAEGIRGGLMLIYGIILFILLQKKPAVKDEHENQQSI